MAALDQRVSNLGRDGGMEGLSDLSVSAKAGDNVCPRFYHRNV